MKRSPNCRGMVNGVDVVQLTEEEVVKSAGSTRLMFVLSEEVHQGSRFCRSGVWERGVFCKCQVKRVHEAWTLVSGDEAGSAAAPNSNRRLSVVHTDDLLDATGPLAFVVAVVGSTSCFLKISRETDLNCATWLWTSIAIALSLAAIAALLLTTTSRNHHHLQNLPTTFRIYPPPYRAL